MRTALFVHEPTTVTIRASSPLDAAVRICRYQQAAVPAVGTHKLERGIYVIASRAELEVLGDNLTIEIMRGDKDIWPDPKAQLVALEPGASVESVQEFLQIAKDISVDG